jgi:hypothetical protein
MSWFDLLGAAVGGGGLGVISGLIGTAVTKYSEFQTKKADLAILKEQNAHARLLSLQEQEGNLKLAAMTAQSQERVAEINAQARAIEMASLDFRASHESDRATHLAPEAQKNSMFATVLMAVVDFMRGFIRPGATIYSYVLLTGLVLWVTDLYRSKAFVLTNDQAFSIATMILGTVVYLVTTCTVWWFGIRPNAPPQTSMGTRGAPLQMQ